MTDADVDAFLASQTFAKLKSLDLWVSNRLSPASQKKLKQRFGSNLRLDVGRV